MLFETISMKFDVIEIHGGHGFLEQLCFTLFGFFAVFIGTTMFISIISDSFRIVRNGVNYRTNEEHDFLAFIGKKF